MAVHYHVDKYHAVRIAHGDEGDAEAFASDRMFAFDELAAQRRGKTGRAHIHAYHAIRWIEDPGLHSPTLGPQGEFPSHYKTPFEKVPGEDAQTITTLLGLATVWIAGGPGRDVERPEALPPPLSSD